MFTTPCFIRKNTPELRDKLEGLGYSMRYQHSYGNQVLFVNDEFIHETNVDYPSYNLIIKERSIDCSENEALFLAIAALRDDSDYMQVYTDSEKWIICDSSDFNRWYIENHNLRKATVTELINHFK
ncbi:hypothetical protein [Dysgonomonas sp. GY617]|uniref:hypothetical protein n=1 Tax=Dysgonomonas sp. GY617 TaxID=2780420 RepID=UPI0018F0526F|nr:hypothetical protein [Dysgonomonas sp. GY617]